MADEGPWAAHARSWSHFGSPLRPSPEDVRAALSEVLSWARERADTPSPALPSPSFAAPGPRALLLGVTPELATMDWPQGTSLVAVDRSAAMIDSVFPKVGLPERTRAIPGEWEALPVPDASADVVIGDGCLSLFEFPDGARRLAAEVRRTLAPGGRWVIRIFAAPEIREDLAAIAADLRRGAIGSFHALKWRAAMALQASAETGVVLGEVYTAIQSLRPILSGLPAKGGFAKEVVDTIEAYRGSKVKYAFPTALEIREALSDTLVLTRRIDKSYELGDRCPTLVLRAR